MKRMKRQLILSKGREIYVFRYEKGNEEKVILAAAGQLVNSRLSFDLFDMEIVSRKMWSALIEKADELLRETNMESQ